MEALRISSLRLVHFRLVDAAFLGKQELFLDLSQSHKTINVFVGPMGSGKTALLGQLHPFAGYGSLDVRGQDDPILEGKTGRKEIVYEKGSSVYTIQHEYTWAKTKHVLKSFLQKDGEELNENGNQSSFRIMVAQELGMEQDLLRLIRLGSNVTNLILMKSTDRKTFVASLLPEADLYTMLFRKLTIDARNVNAQVTILGNKLTHLGGNQIEEWETKLEETQEKLERRRSQLNQRRDFISQRKADRIHLLHQMDREAFVQKMTEQASLLEDLRADCAKRRALLSEMETTCSIEDLSKQMGKVEQSLQFLQEDLASGEREHQVLQGLLDALEDQTKLHVDPNYVKQLQRTQTELIATSKQLQRELGTEPIPFSSGQLQTLLGDLNSANYLLQEIREYNPDLVRDVLCYKGNIVTYANHQKEKLDRKKGYLEKKLKAIEYAIAYREPDPLFVPPLCPTKDCPFRVTHPAVRQKELIGKEKEEISGIQRELKTVELTLFKIESYPYIGTKCQTFLSLWDRYVPMLRKAKAFGNSNAQLVLTNPNIRSWYDYDRLTLLLEKGIKREKLEELTTQLKQIQLELDEMGLQDQASLEGQKTDLLQQQEKIRKRIQEEEASIRSQSQERDRLQDQIQVVSNRALLEEEGNEWNALEEEWTRTQRDREQALEEVDQLDRQMGHDLLELSQLEKEYGSLEREKADLSLRLHEIQYTQTEYASAREEQTIRSLILDAVSSRKGIPMRMIELFLSDCKTIVNELIADVFDGSLELENFVLNETEFRIPYRLNGKHVDDIGSASQGQQAVISVALSFALIAQVSPEYNILLLDEMDGPLYKRDRERFVQILLKQLEIIGAKQIFLISHNSTFEGYPVHMILTRDEPVYPTELISVTNLME